MNSGLRGSLTTHTHPLLSTVHLALIRYYRGDNRRQNESKPYTLNPTTKPKSPKALNP